MKKFIVTAAALASLTLAGTAMAGGYFTTGRQTFYKTHILFRATYEVFDSRGYCYIENGVYNDLNCLDYDRGRAPVDFRIMRMDPNPHIVFSDRLRGRYGRVKRDLFDSEYVDWSCPPSTVHYRAIFRLRDPITKRVVATRTKFFRIWCS